MPLPTQDPLTYHLAGLCAAWLRDKYGADAVLETFDWPTQPPPAGACPALVVTRESETWQGYPGQRWADVRVTIAYYAGTLAGAAGAEGGGWDPLWAVMRQVDRCVHKLSHPAWQTGQHIGYFTGIQTAELVDVAYPAPALGDAQPTSVQPSCAATVALVVRDDYETAEAHDADSVTIDVNNRDEIVIPVDAAAPPFEVKDTRP